MLVLDDFAVVAEVTGDDRHVGLRVERVQGRDGAGQTGGGVDLGQNALVARRRSGNRRLEKAAGREDVRVGDLRDEHHGLPRVNTKTPCSASRLASEPRGSSENGRPWRSSVTLFSMRMPISLHSTTKSLIVQRWIFGDSYHW